MCLLDMFELIPGIIKGPIAIITEMTWNSTVEAHVIVQSLLTFEGLATGRTHVRSGNKKERF